MRKRLIILMLTVVIAAAAALAGFAYSGFVSETIYEESTAHLVEIFHQANQALYNMVSVNWSRMRMWVPYIETAESEQDIVAYLNQAREESNFTDFFFISRNGNYITLEGQKGYLDLRNKLEDLILEQKPIVVNSVVPDKPEIMVFATPAVPSSYRGFEYEAIAITYNNSDLVEALKISAFGGKAGTFAILPDGRVVVDNGSEELNNIHNFFALLERSDNITDDKIDEIQEDFLAGNSGEMIIDINGTDYYLVYEPANFQDWIVLGIVPADVVNASMNNLQSTTIAVVSVIVIALAVCLLLFVIQQNRQKLRLKDNELVARDELFSKLSTNVDDVFLMLNAENLRVDYVSPNIEKLLGISEARVKEDVHVLEKLIKDNGSAHILDQISDIMPGYQKEWDREYVHMASKEVRWFHVVAFCSDIQGAKKYILDMSDRTSDKKINQELENAVHIAQNA
ncbi:MAG: PAS domain-containing sensor histidine kinase, partial [Oscillospiraceae bacterium]